MKRAIYRFTILFIIFFAVFNLYSQVTRSKNSLDEKLIERASLYLMQEQYEEAEKIYRRLNRRYPQSQPTLKGLLQVYIGQENWRKAEEIGTKINKLFPESAAWNYVSAIILREKAKNRPQIYFRPKTFNKSENFFKRGIKQDSSFLDIFYQWAELERYREDYCTAVQLCHKQLEINKNTPIARIEIFKMYDYLLENLPLDSAESWLLKRNTVYDHYALGELYRRNGLFSPADSIFQLILDNPKGMELQPVYLSLVRLAVQENNPVEAQYYYQQAVDSISSPAAAILMTHYILLIANENEYQAFKYFESFNAVKEKITKFWLIRDPMPASEYNRRLIQHFQRLIYAEENFRYDGFRHALSKSDALNRLVKPYWSEDNYKFNDKGLIYLRYGEPDDKAFDFRRNERNMSWLYLQTGELPKMIFHFVVPEYAPSGYWTLSPYMTGEELHDWDIRFYELENTRDYTQRAVLENELVEQRAQDVYVALRNDSYKWEEEIHPLDLVYKTAEFQLSGKENLIQLFYGIPKSELFERTRKDSITLKTGISVFDSSMNQLYTRRREFTVYENKDRHFFKEYFIDEFEYQLKPELHNIAFHINIPETKQMNGARFNYPDPLLRENTLSLSSLKLSYSILLKANSNQRDREHITMIPNPSSRFKRKDAVFAYYELYNLTPDRDGNTHYTVTFNLTQTQGGKKSLTNLWGVLGEGKPYTVSISNTYKGKTINEEDFISIDVSSAAKGQYELEIRVEDQNSGTVKTSSTELWLE